MKIESANTNDSNENQDENATPTAADELALLKQRAALMGITHSPNIGIDTLKAKIEASTSEVIEEEKVKPVAEIDQPRSNPYTNTRNRIRNEALKLIRIRLTNMNPGKADLHGDLYAVSNKFIGEIRKFIPYDPKFYENGYHVPQCILNQLQTKQFMSTRIVKDPTVPSGERTEAIMVKEFAIEILPPLTDIELKKLAADQRARNATA